jgi:Flp pilus assembly protein TadG
MTPSLQTRLRGAIKRPAGRSRTIGSRGAVTAEFAVALPAVLMLLAMLLAGSAAGITQLRLEEAARASARALARGEDPAVVDGIVRKLAGATASSVVAADGEWQRVTVSDRMAGYLRHVVPWTLTAGAEARTESAESADLPVDPRHADSTMAADSLQTVTYSRQPV